MVPAVVPTQDDHSIGFAFASDLIAQGAYGMAVRVARAAAAALGGDLASEFGLAAILVDAGDRMRSRRLIAEGVARMEAIRETVPRSAYPALQYNLGNAYLALGGSERGYGPLTRPSLVRAVSAFAESIALAPRVEAEINLASAFVQQGRHIEAIDLVTSVLKRDPDHPVAHATRARAVEGVYRWILPHRGLLTAAVNDAKHALDKALALGAQDYARAYLPAFERLRTFAVPHYPVKSVRASFEDWVWDSRLALNPCELCGVETPNAFDTYVLPGRVAGGIRRPSLAEVAEIVNGWHQAFSTPRWNLAQALGIVGPLPDDHVVLISGLPGSRNGLRTGLLLSAISGFYSVFDKIAFGLNSYLHLGHRPHDVSFTRIWSRHDRKTSGRSPAVPESRAELHPAILRTASRSLSALYHLAQSMATAGGTYRALRELRNEAEHRLLVVSSAPAQSRYFSVVDEDDLIARALTLGRVAKAAVNYAGGTLWWCESRRAHVARRAGQLLVDSEHSNQVHRA